MTDPLDPTDSPAVPNDAAPAAVPAPAATPAGTSAPAAQPAPEPPSSTVDDRVTVRRAPKYPRFIILGAGLGAIVTFILTNLFQVDPLVGFGPLFGYFLLFGVPAGAALGGIIAIVLDIVATKRARQFDAERTTVDALPEELEGELED